MFDVLHFKKERKLSVEKDESNAEKLFHFAESGFSENVRALLNNKECQLDVNELHRCKMYDRDCQVTPLYVAMENGRWDAAKILEAAGGISLIVTANNAGDQLHDAIRKRDIKKLRILLKAQIDIDAKDENGNTPVFNALKHFGNDVEVLLILIAAGANLCTVNPDELSPLQYAQENGLVVPTALIFASQYKSKTYVGFDQRIANVLSEAIENMNTKQTTDNNDVTTTTGVTATTATTFVPPHITTQISGPLQLNSIDKENVVPTYNNIHTAPALHSPTLVPTSRPFSVGTATMLKQKGLKLQEPNKAKETVPVPAAPHETLKNRLHSSVASITTSMGSKRSK